MKVKGTFKLWLNTKQGYWFLENIKEGNHDILISIYGRTYVNTLAGRKRAEAAAEDFAKKHGFEISWAEEG